MLISEFVDKLADKLDFQSTGPGEADYTWLCGKDGDRFYYSKQTLAENGVQDPDAFIEGILVNRYLRCDCEIVFNMSEEHD